MEANLSARKPNLTVCSTHKINTFENQMAIEGLFSLRQTVVAGRRGRTFLIERMFKYECTFRALK